jgi:hypothetical protein
MATIIAGFCNRPIIHPKYRARAADATRARRAIRYGVLTNMLPTKRQSAPGKPTQIPTG